MEKAEFNQQVSRALEPILARESANMQAILSAAVGGPISPAVCRFADYQAAQAILNAVLSWTAAQPHLTWMHSTKSSINMGGLTWACKSTREQTR